MYKFYNRNPNKEKLPDCVCRAVSIATESPYYMIWDLLRQNGLDRECDDINLECYAELLRDIGYTWHDACGKTVAEVARQYPYSRLIIRIEGHLTCSLYGVCHDIWDCTKEIADCYWIIE